MGRKKQRNRAALPANRPTPTRGAVARPQDHNPPATQETLEYYETEVLGRTWRVMADNLDDMRFAKAMRRLSEGDPLEVDLIGEIALGADQYAEALELLADENGRVRLTAFVQFITDLLQGR